MDRERIMSAPWDHAPRFLLRDRDSIYGAAFTGQVNIPQNSS